MPSQCEAFADDAADVLAAAELVASSGSWSPAGTSPRASAPSSWRCACPGPRRRRRAPARSGVKRNDRDGADRRDGGESRQLRDRQTGLDFDRMWSPTDAQLANLRRTWRCRSRPASPRSSTAARRRGNAMPRTPCSPICERPASREAGRTRSGRGAAGDPHRCRAGRLRRAALEMGCRSACRGSHFRTGEEATAVNVRLMARSGCSSRPTRRTSRPRRSAAPNEPATGQTTARGSPNSAARPGRSRRRARGCLRRDVRREGDIARRMPSALRTEGRTVAGSAQISGVIEHVRQGSRPAP